MGFLGKLFAFSLVSAVLPVLLWHYGHKVLPSSELPKIPEGWWAVESKEKFTIDETIRPFEIKVPETILTDLKERLKKSKFTKPLEEVNFEYGFNTNYLQEVVEYWLSKYDWRKHEKHLNQFKGYKTQIDGIDVHFLHVKPKTVGKNQKVIPLLMIHGWPGSVYEFYKILPLLTTPRKDKNFVFEVICPHIPGYAFSEAPHRKGFGPQATIHHFSKLMKRLGFNNYYLQGGDWGSIISNNLALYFPERIKGLHINMVTFATQGQWLKWLFGQLYPRAVVEDKYYDKFYPVKKIVHHSLQETGYMHLQATKPDTVGVALGDSPVGLAAYILEKFSTWMNKDYRHLQDGGLTKKLTLDELLTNVMLYWVTDSITTSMRFYKEFFNGYDLKLQEYPVIVPTAIASFPDEIVHIPESLTEHVFQNVIQYTEMPRGGHFAAFEEPQLLADDIYSFVEKVENLPEEKKDENQN